MARRLLAVVALAAAGVAVLLWALGGMSGRVEVDAVRVTRGPLEVTLPVTGIVETRAVELAFEVPGRLAAVHVREGEAVRAGQVLAALDAAELEAAVEQAEAAAEAARAEAARAQAAVTAARQQAEQAEAAARVAQAQLRQLRAGARASELRQAEAAVAAAASAREQARRTLELNEQLARQGAVARSQVDAARAQYEAAEAQYRQAVAQLETLRAGARPEAVEAAAQQARQAEAAASGARANVAQAEAVAAAARATARQAEAAVRAARVRARRTRLTAPFDGTVTRVSLVAGAPVVPNVPVVSLAAPGGWIVADVDEADIDEVRVGQLVRVTADAYPGLTATGRVTRIGGAVELRGGARAVRVRIDLDAPTRMRPGTGVDVSIVLARAPSVLLVPLEAVIPGENGEQSVFVVEHGVLRRRTVALGRRNELSAQVTAGLREGEYVAVADPAVLRDGARVRVRSLR